MREAATEAFKRAVAGGATQAEAKELARKAGKAAWKAAKRPAAARAASAAAAGAAAGEAAGVAAGVAAPTVLVLGPTRELCQQTAETARAIGAGVGVTTACVVGGVDYGRQRDAVMRTRAQLMVATPGRLLSLCGETPASSRARQAAGAKPPDTEGEEPACSLAAVALLVLDEADRLLEHPNPHPHPNPDPNPNPEPNPDPNSNPKPEPEPTPTPNPNPTPKRTGCSRWASRKTSRPSAA
jgi:hypothetical protein